MNTALSRYAPILWFHEKEDYKPIEIKSIVEHSELYNKTKKVKYRRKIKDICNLEKNGKDHVLALPNIDLGLSRKNNYLIKSEKGAGLTNVTEAIREFYRHIESSYKKVVYARQGTFNITANDFDANVFSGNWRTYQKKLIGNYNVYQYFPFYFFNDFTNLHIGDWDSTVEIYINNSKNQSWIRTRSHNFSWLMKLNKSNQYTNIRSWLKKWQKHKKGVCDIFNINKHPFVFVSKGGHGCYPTPGYSVRGIKQFELPIAFEERDIAKTCYIPKLQNSDKNISSQIKAVLKQSNIQTKNLNIVEYEILDFNKEEWCNFRGRWGNRSDYRTWDSPTSAPHKPEFKISKRNFIKNFKSEFKRGYETELIFYNYHGLLST